MKDWLCLPTITRLLSVVTSLTLDIKAVFAFLVLGHLVKGMLFAILSLAKGLLRFGYVHLKE